MVTTQEKAVIKTYTGKFTFSEVCWLEAYCFVVILACADRFVGVLSLIWCGSNTDIDSGHYRRPLLLHVLSTSLDPDHHQ